MAIDFRIIGDVHGNYLKYHQLIKKAHTTLQLGDFGFDYSTLRHVDAKRHRIVGGNHDNYGDIDLWPHFLGSYGTYNVPCAGNIFFVRGGLSIDKECRTEGRNWWRDEELSLRECTKALIEYKNTRPHFVVSHECPLDIVHRVISPLSNIIKSRTNQLLNEMLRIHQPMMWVFGHYHASYNEVVGRTNFIGLNELECLDL